MAYRLSKIVTRTGDDGSTGLADGSRLAKYHPRIVVLGEIDELNSQLGLVLCEDLPPALRQDLLRIQHELFDLGGELCLPGQQVITEDHLLRLEQAVSTYNDDLPPLREFILPGGSRAAAQLHIARTVCRRAERSLVLLACEAACSPLAQRYLNRLSDLLFVAARCANRHHQVADVYWRHERSSP